LKCFGTRVRFPPPPVSVHRGSGERRLPRRSSVSREAGRLIFSMDRGELRPGRPVFVRSPLAGNGDCPGVAASAAKPGARSCRWTAVNCALASHGRHLLLRLHPRQPTAPGPPLHRLDSRSGRASKRPQRRSLPPTPRSSSPGSSRPPSLSAPRRKRSLSSSTSNHILGERSPPSISDALPAGRGLDFDVTSRLRRRTIDAIEAYQAGRPHQSGFLFVGGLADPGTATTRAATGAGMPDSIECAHLRDGANTAAIVGGADLTGARLLAEHRVAITDAYDKRNPRIVADVCAAIANHYIPNAPVPKPT
jgi:hypothetical protein